MKINFINNSYRRFYRAHKAKIHKALKKCLANGDFILREDVEKFEKTLAKYVGVKYAVGVNSGTDALFLSLKALGIKEGDKVITVGHTFIATIQVIVHCGATPILVDVKRDGLMDMDKLEDLIKSHNENDLTESKTFNRIKAIIPVHLSGKVCDMKRLQAICKKYGLFIVEDACQALGATVGGNKAGSMGDTGCFSFISAKLLGCYGDAGAIVTDNKKIYEKLLLLRNHWNINQLSLMGYQPKQPEIMGWGWNSRLDNIQAAVLNVKFPYLKSILKRREDIAKMYNNGLKNPNIELPVQYKGQVYTEYIINVDDPVKFKNYMAGRGIETLIRDLIPNHKLKGLNLEKFDLPVTEELAKRQARLPLFPELTNVEVKKIIKAVNDYK